MNRVGLALSGGGFRATLYHLGVVRFLRDAEILPKVTHMTTVSGGSILGAHMALNWDKYCGSGIEFDQAADQIIRFVQLDVRNRIVRRFPFASATNTVRRMCRLGAHRQLTRPGLLERHYERYLYGDTSLFQLPERPRLHILATNLSEGCLCSFNQGGLFLQRRTRGRRDRFEKVHLGLATVPMAVAASSAFPGFFPPLELNSWDVGADEGEFSRQAFTDGGVYDNLGLRMFRCIEQSWIREITPLRKGDFLELADATAALMSADSLPENTPLRRLREMLSSRDPSRLGLGPSRPPIDPTKAIMDGLWEIIKSEELYLDPSFQNMELADASAQSLLGYVAESGRSLELSDRLWLNRQIVESALRQVVGKPCLRMARTEFDSIMVSDSGGKFKVAADRRAGGLVRTALRSSDILMDRVWQLEVEAFENSPGVVFFPISDCVERSQDRSAPHPEIQRQAARIRTDMDRFTELEISALVQHGYCVARKACRAQGGIPKSSIPDGAPWDPFAPSDPESGSSPPRSRRLDDQARALPAARLLQNSSRRRIWSRLLSLGDWPTYLWMPILAFLVASAMIWPYLLYKSNQRSRRQKMVLTAIADTSPVYRRILDLLEQGPAPPYEPMPYKVVTSMEPVDYTGFEVLSDTRIFDLRGWFDQTSDSTITSTYAQVEVHRTEEARDNTHLRLQRQTVDDAIALRCRSESLLPTLSRMQQPDGTFLWEFDLDFSRVAIDRDVEVVIEADLTSDSILKAVDEGRFYFTIATSTALVQVWVLMPEGRTYRSFVVSAHPIDRPELARVVVPDSGVELPFGTVAMFRLINPDEKQRYECRWTWTDE